MLSFLVERFAKKKKRHTDLEKNNEGEITTGKGVV
jgi:hypothetical protein